MPYFSCDDWNMLTEELFQHCVSVKLQTTVPLCDAVLKPHDLDKGTFDVALLRGQIFLDKKKVMVGSVCGFPLGLSTCAANLENLCKHAHYPSFVNRILSDHLREHSVIRSSESRSRRVTPIDNSRHLERLKGALDQAIQWVLAEDAAVSGVAEARTTSDTLMMAVFQLTPKEFSTVAPYRQQVALEFYYALCNFFCHYFFCQPNARPGQKLFVSVMPLQSGSHPLHCWRSARSALMRTVEHADVTNLAATTVVDDDAWHLIHSGTSDLVPLILTLFGFEDATETASLRRQREEREICDGFEVILSEIDASEAPVVHIPNACPEFYAPTMHSMSYADALKWQEKFSIEQNSHHIDVSLSDMAVHHSDLGQPLLTPLTILQRNKSDNTSVRIVGCELEIGNASSNMFDKMGRKQRCVWSQCPPGDLSSTSAWEWRRSFVHLATENQSELAVQFVVLCATSINRAHRCDSSTSELCQLFADRLKSWTSEILQAATAEFRNRMEILQAVCHVAHQIPEEGLSEIRRRFSSFFRQIVESAAEKSFNRKVPVNRSRVVASPFLLSMLDPQTISRSDVATQHQQSPTDEELDVAHVWFRDVDVGHVKETSVLESVRALRVHRTQSVIRT